MPARKPLAPTYGRWTVLEEGATASDGVHRTALCRCICGAEKWVKLQHLRTGESKSCGCYRLEQATERMRGPIGKRMRTVYHQQTAHLIHGESAGRRRTPEYRAWALIHRKGKTNLSVEDWIATFGRRPSPGHLFKNGRWRLKPRNTRVRPTEFKLSKEQQTKIDQQLAAEKEAAEAWLKKHEAEVPKVLGYMLDKPRFIMYIEPDDVGFEGQFFTGRDMIFRGGLWAGLDGRRIC